ncbi:Modification methylase HphIA [Tolypocladium ophioglossoides CBS 100239]|uniref:DNA (cytosine-5-)-methyltransferase n=1 Tax=Tolypocladium ophioglossoides (strain CBS 100239) TaxID=1163406 RepID=A0A0L0N0F0_TOLOC|nr:Modification methylase HphIA [Tolypocladium ophioglossoides CBS 100239]
MPALREDTMLLISSPASGARSRAPSVASSCTLVNESRQRFEAEHIFDDDIIDLTEDSDTAGNHGLRDGEIALEQLRIRGQIFTRGDMVELNPESTYAGIYPVDFLEVKVVLRNRTGEPKLRGIPLTRTRNMGGKLPKKLNEVCAILHINRGGWENANDNPICFDVSPDSVVKKRTLVVTNAVYPEHRSPRTAVANAQVGDGERQRRRAESRGVLVCRWRHNIYFIVHGRQTRPQEEVLERIPASDVSDSRYRISDETLCNRWRGGRVKGGSWGGGQHNNLIDLDAVSRPSSASGCSGTRGSQQKYTVFDAFSGAGGVSRGAQSAGFKIQYAVDKSSDVWDTYRLNFPEAILYGMAIDKFIQTTQNEFIRVDVLHLSPPCQYFSPAHTHNSVHDDENIFALFGCNHLIHKTRPRIITVEQTFGITHGKHVQYLQALIGDFTQFGYSVRWKVVRLCTWGSPQDRKRLVVIAAAPGEKLPPFPRATHSENGAADGCKPFTTFRQAMSGIRQGDHLHNTRTVRHFQPRRAPFDSDRLTGTITTGSGDIYYPDGTRDLTLREYACLQGFPRHHQFVGNKTSIRRQIGNAFPPNTVRVLYNHLQEWLLKEDCMKPYQPSVGDVLAVDDDDVDSASASGVTERFGTVSSPSMMDMMEIDDDEPVHISRGQFERHAGVIDLN